MLIYLGLGSLQSALSLILLPAYAHILPVSEFGLLALVLSLEQLFLLLMDCGLSGGAVRTYHDKARQDLPFMTGPVLIGYFQRLSLGISFAAMFVLAGVLLVLDQFFPQPELVVSAFAITVVSAWLQRINTFAATTYRAQEDARSFAVLALARMIGLTTLTLLLIFVFKVGLLGILASRIVIFGGTALYESRNAWKLRLTGEEHRRTKEFVRDSVKRFSVPMLPFDLLAWGRSRGNRLAVAGAFNLTALGIWNAAAAPGQILTLVGQSFNRGFEPFFYRKANEETAEAEAVVRDMGAGYLVVQAVLALGVIAVMPEVFRILFPKDYHSASLYAPLALTAAFVEATQSLSIRALFAFGAVRLVPVVLAVATGLGLSTMALLAHLFGLTGAMAGQVMMSVYGSVFAWFLVKRLHHTRFFPSRAAIMLTTVVTGASLLPFAMPEFWMSAASIPVRGLIFGGAIVGIAWLFALRHPEFVLLVRERINQDKGKIIRRGGGATSTGPQG